MIEFSQKFDSIINIMTAVALIYYSICMSIVEKNGGLRKRLLFLLLTLATLCLSRGVNYLFNFGEKVETFNLIISSIIPLALFLLVELMLRRHFPLSMKVFIGLSSTLLVFAFLIFGVNKFALLLLMVYYVLALLSMLFAILLRKNLELEPSEMGLIKISMLIMIAIVPLIVTDFKIILHWDTIRLGAFGILFFLYAIVKVWENVDVAGGISRLVYLLLFNIAATATICWLFNLQEYYFHVFIIFIMMRMFSDILIYSRDSYSKKAQDTAYQIIDALILGNFAIESIKKEISHNAFFLLTKKDLAHYRPDKIQQAFLFGGLHFKEEILKTIKEQDLREEIIHIYDDFDCNACIFLNNSADNFFIILFKWPSMAPRTKLLKEISLIKGLAMKVKD